jgi:hypothetical protein
VAHIGLVADPTRSDPQGVCGSCHPAIVADSAGSLHTTLEGIRSSLAQRAGTAELGPHLQQAYDNHCSSCHASCGNCHISVPASAGGGLLAGHRFLKKPPMTLVCTACHGSRVGDEYRGLNVGIPPDVHYNKGLQCTSCHSGAEMHGSGKVATHRYDAPHTPSCQDCHPDGTDFRKVGSHALHRDAAGQLKLSCHTCHAVEYKNCASCHVSKNEEGRPFFEVNAPTHKSVMTFKIGLNPLQDARRPEKYVTLRHAPADPDNYAYYGPDLQLAFSVNPTWRLATPHNIRRTTPRSATCNGCHGQRGVFLAPADLLPYEEAANAAVVVHDVPAAF